MASKSFEIVQSTILDKISNFFWEMSFFRKETQFCRVRAEDCDQILASMEEIAEEIAQLREILQQEKGEI